MRSRYYDPGVGRFVSEDTYEGTLTNPLSLNRYTYVENNPLIYVDPTGHWCESADGRWSHPGGCDGGSGGRVRYIPDEWSINFGRPILENGVVVGKWYPEGAFRIEGDPTGISDAVLGCVYDEQCLNFVTMGTAGVVTKAGSAARAVVSGAKKAWSWVKGAFSKGKTIKGAPKAQSIPKIKYPGNDPSKAPGPDWEWRGKGNPGSEKGAWYNPKTKESLKPDLEHPEPIGPHWDYVAPDKKQYRIYPNGRVESK